MEPSEQQESKLWPPALGTDCRVFGLHQIMDNKCRPYFTSWGQNREKALKTWAAWEYLNTDYTWKCLAIQQIASHLHGEIAQSL
jgi:hypothetical protein